MSLTPEQEEVKEESSKGQTSMRVMYAAALAALLQHYRSAVSDIHQLINAAAGVSTGAGAGATAAAVVTPSALAPLMQQIDARLGNLAATSNTTLMTGIDQAATIGARPFMTTVNAAQLDHIRGEAVQAVRNVVGPDKLNLSARVWRIDRHANEVVSQAVRNAVSRGDGASHAARDFLARGIPPPDDIALAQGSAQANNIGKAVEQSLLAGKGAPLDNAMRVMRTEINRAHTIAYQKGAAADTDSIGTKFTLSPRHPRVDICDFHAKANLHGLGPGVYPHGHSPLPAHPNTLSFEVVVYGDEVTAADKAGKQTAVEFLKTVAGKDRAGILGVNKNEAFEAGKLPSTQVRSRWRDVRRRIDRRAPKI